MAQVAIQRDSLVVEIEGFDRVWCQERRIVVPLTNVRGAHLDRRLDAETPWIGSGENVLLPGSLAAGPMIVNGRREFWDVRDPDRSIVIDLKDERYSRLVIDVEDRLSLIRAINAALERTKAQECERNRAR